MPQELQSQVEAGSSAAATSEVSRLQADLQKKVSELQSVQQELEALRESHVVRLCCSSLIPSCVHIFPPATHQPTTPSPTMSNLWILRS